MDEGTEKRELDELSTDVYNFDELIESDLGNNGSTARNPREILTVPETRYENKGGTFLTGIDIFSKEEKQKIEERVKRFGLTDNQIFSRLEEYQDLYSSMGVTEENENTKNFRLNVLHVRGTEEMSTKDVFKYFEDYAPASIEWINDVSCNVVWLDSASAARALVGLSMKIIGLDKRTQINSNPTSNDHDDDVVMKDMEVDEIDENTDKKDQNIVNEKEIHVKDIEYPLPPGIWRKGIDCPKSNGIFMRFATRTDKKQPNAERMSEYYKKYGNPNFGGVKGILTESRKRTYRQTTQSRKKTKENLTDDVKDVSKNPWGDLSQTWGVNDTLEDDFIQKYHVPEQTISIKERLGLRNRQRETPVVSEESSSESASEDEDDWCKKSKVPRMRMHADDEEEKLQKRRGKIHTQETSNASKDLRSRLGRTRKELVRDAIQIVVTNYEPSKADISEEEEGEIVTSESEDQLENNEEEQEEDGEIEIEVEEEEEEEEIEKEDEKEEGEEDSNDSELSEKEVRGPKGSVIKVVARKPRVASTVWTRLNRSSVKSEVKAVKNSHPPRRDLRETLRGDLRSRLGKHTKARGRSPLRIEVKNDKCADDNSDYE